MERHFDYISNITLCWINRKTEQWNIRIFFNLKSFSISSYIYIQEPQHFLYRINLSDNKSKETDRLV